VIVIVIVVAESLRLSITTTKRSASHERCADPGQVTTWIDSQSVNPT
jgi:hypothetical protein